jgi:hypothetical protein
LVALMGEVQTNHDDIFGTEGYQFRIMGKDWKKSKNLERFTRLATYN